MSVRNVVFKGTLEEINKGIATFNKGVAGFIGGFLPFVGLPTLNDVIFYQFSYSDLFSLSIFEMYP